MFPVYCRFARSQSRTLQLSSRKLWNSKKEKSSSITVVDKNIAISYLRADAMTNLLCVRQAQSYSCLVSLVLCPRHKSDPSYGQNQAYDPLVSHRQAKPFPTSLFIFPILWSFSSPVTSTRACQQHRQYNQRSNEPVTNINSISWYKVMLCLKGSQTMMIVYFTGEADIWRKKKMTEVD